MFDCSHYPFLVILWLWFKQHMSSAFIPSSKSTWHFISQELICPSIRKYAEGIRPEAHAIVTSWAYLFYFSQFTHPCQVLSPIHTEILMRAIVTLSPTKFCLLSISLFLFLPAGKTFGTSHTYIPWEFELLDLKLPFTTSISILPSDILVGKLDWPPSASSSLLGWSSHSGWYSSLGFQHLFATIWLSRCSKLAWVLWLISEALDQSIWLRDMVNIFMIQREAHPCKFYAQTDYSYPQIPCHLILLQLTYLLPIDLVIKERQLTYVAISTAWNGRVCGLNRVATRVESGFNQAPRTNIITSKFTDWLMEDNKIKVH